MDRSLPLFLRRAAHSLFRIYYNMGDCIFCKIVAGEAKASIVYKDENVTAFRDIHPLAPTHILIVPNRHIDSVGTLTEADEALAGRLLLTARNLAEQEGIAQSGYRLITNTGVDGGQTVYHLHVHLIGGQHMLHPMG
jgi:histidine triad (HIT) family protein